MSDFMESHVLTMPYELAMVDELSRMQFWSRAQLAYKELVQARAALAQQQDKLQVLWTIVNNDAYAITFQTMSAYRRALLNDISRLASAPPAPQAEQPRQTVGLTVKDLAQVTHPWAHIWSNESFGIARAAIAKFCEVNGITAPKEPT